MTHSREITEIPVKMRIGKARIVTSNKIYTRFEFSDTAVRLYVFLLLVSRKSQKLHVHAHFDVHFFSLPSGPRGMFEPKSATMCHL